MENANSDTFNSAMIEQSSNQQRVKIKFQVKEVSSLYLYLYLYLYPYRFVLQMKRRNCRAPTRRVSTRTNVPTNPHVHPTVLRLYLSKVFKKRAPGEISGDSGCNPARVAA